MPNEQPKRNSNEVSQKIEWSPNEELTYVPKIKIVRAVRWYQNGDHPDDNCEIIQGSEGPFLSEGKVIRYYRHPAVPGHATCNICGCMMHEHGFLERMLTNDDVEQVVCPGDYIITLEQGRIYESIQAGQFEKLYDKV